MRGAALAGLALSVAGTLPSCLGADPEPVATHLFDEIDVTPDVDDLAFLSGRWLGEAFGGVAEETWNPPLGGQMLGTFRLVQDGAPVFSEHMLLTELDGKVVLRLKHFEPDLVGWEEKGEFLDFELLSVSGDSARFDGLTFDRDGDQLRIGLTMQGEEGPREEVMLFERVR